MMKINIGSILFGITIIVVSLNFTACSTTSPQVQVENRKHTAYKNAMQNVGAQIKGDPNYRKIDLTTRELKNWFTDLTYKLWDRQISKEQFIAYGVKVFPGYYDTFDLISDGLLSM